MDCVASRILLDLEEVTLVALDIVQFLASCEAGGLEVPHCRLTYASGSQGKMTEHAEERSANND